MTNFAFIERTWPELYADCARAESYLGSDPRTAAIYARRAAEVIVNHIYDVAGLTPPYRDDLAARIGDPSFARAVGPAITAKLDLIRAVGNKAVHDRRTIAAERALGALRDLYHVVIFATYHFSASPGTAPLSSRFDPALAAREAPLTQDQVQALVARFQAQDEARTKDLADRDAVIAHLREQIAAAQASRGPDTHDYDEAATRTDLIDERLGEAGWALDQSRDREFPVTGMPTDTGRGSVDYVLWGRDGRSLGLVEAKRTSTSAHAGQEQARLYADCLEKATGCRPVIFFSNGHEHWIWDDAAGEAPRQIQGFYTRDELELLVERRTSRRDPADVPIDTAIVERPYQQRAIRAVGAAYTKKQRGALVVMATGAGKTRMAVALVDQLSRANWVKRVLFLADRTALVRQAVGAFKAHLPSTTTVNLLDHPDAEGRVYVSTYPTMLNLINDDTGLRRFSPGFFDLVIIDEAHRSVYQKYADIFTWFDSLLLGLTATPKTEVDRNTYRLFGLEEGVPTDSYSLQEAVDDHWLVPPVAVSVGTKFLRQGIRYEDLSEDEKDQWDSLDWGDGPTPEAVDPEELNSFLFNADTVDKVLQTLMEKGYRVSGGDQLAKTIIFAKNIEHADFIVTRFNAQYPGQAGVGARAITYQTSYAQHLIDAFETPAKPPDIAVSVDMLDTGIDIPEVANLVFFKLVRSKTKFWQMIGRGTRLCPDLFGPGHDKANFFVFDFCGNLEFFSQDLPESPGSIQVPLSRRLFEARLGLVVALDKTGTEPELRESTARTLHRYVAAMNLDNISVRARSRFVERYAEWANWSALSPIDAADVLTLAGLPSADVDADEAAKRFDLLVLTHQLAILDSDALTAERVRKTIQAIAARLLAKTAIPAVAAEAARLEDLASDAWWTGVTLPLLEVVRMRLRGLVRLLDAADPVVVYSDFVDELGEARVIGLPGTAIGTDSDRFRAKAAAYLRKHESNLALQRLKRNRPLTPGDLDELERMLRDSAAGNQTDIEREARRAGGLGLFIRSLVGLDRAAATEAFATYLEEGTASADQIHFVGLIIDELTRNGVVDPERLYESPYTDYAPRGPDLMFPPDDLGQIVATLHAVRHNAELPVAA